MILNFSIVLILTVLNAVFVCSEVTILSSWQTIYHSTPALRITGSGFEGHGDNIFLDIYADGEVPLTLHVHDDYEIDFDNIADSRLVLRLQANKSWTHMSNSTAGTPSALILRGVRVDQVNNPNVLSEAVMLARVIDTPSIDSSDQRIFMSGTNELRLLGAGLMGAKRVDLYFYPPIFKDINYEIVSPMPIRGSTLVLRIRHGYQWRDSPGPLSLLGIDTGAGPVALHIGPVGQGVVVAQVVDDSESRSVAVEESTGRQMYHDSPESLHISGSNFNPDHTVVRFENGLLAGVNYTATAVTWGEITLKLLDGSCWISPDSVFPAPLTVRAVDVGAGFVSVGEGQGDKRGSDVATVFLRPVIEPSSIQIFQSHSHELHLSGSGFRVGMELRFSSGIVMGVDYTLVVASSSTLRVSC